MKQTNNAIKFLMAQYRAIFKNANLKMFLAAATAAAALAAGQAQAATDQTLDNSKFDANAPIDVTITGDASADDAKKQYKNFTISGGEANAAFSNTQQNIITVTGGKSDNQTASSFEGKENNKQGSIDLSSTTLNIAATGADQTHAVVNVGASDKSVALTLKEVNVTKGTLQIGKDGGSQKNSTLTVLDSISVGGDGPAHVNLKKQAELKGKTLNVNKGAAITLGNAAKILSSEINVTDGAISLDGGEGADIAVLGSSTSVVKITGGEVKTSAASKHGSIVGGTITLSDNGKIANSEALTITAGDGGFTANGGTIENKTAGKTITFVGKTDLLSGTTIDSSGSIAFKGNATIADGVTLTLDANSSTKILADGNTTSTLNVSKEVFGKLTKEATQKINVSGAASSTNEIHFTDDVVNLGTTGGIGVFADDTGKLVATKVELDNSNAGKLKLSANKVELKIAKIDQDKVEISAKELTVGTGNSFIISGGSILEAGHLLTVDDGTKELKIQHGQVDLADHDNLSGNTIKAKAITIGEGQNAGHLNVTAGEWSVSGIKLVKGDATVINDAVLKLSGDLTTTSDGKLIGSNTARIDATGVGKLTLGAAGVELNNSAVLDLDVEDVLAKDGYAAKAVTGSSTSTINLKSGGAVATIDKAKFQELSKKAEFGGLWGVNIEGLVAPGTTHMGLGGDNGIIAGVGSGYQDVQADVDGSVAVDNNYSAGNVHLTKGDALTIGKGAMTLQNANANGANGMFVSTGSGADTKLAGVKFNGTATADSAIKFEGAGTVGSITIDDAAKGKGRVEVGGEGKKTADVTVSGGIGSPNANIGELTLNEGSKLTVQSGDVYVTTLKLAQGTDLDATGQKVVVGDAAAPIDLTLSGSVTAGTLEFKAKDDDGGKVALAGNAESNVTNLIFGKKQKITLGTGGVEASESVEGSSGSYAQIFTDKLTLGEGSTLFLDPAYGQKASLLVAKEFSSINASADTSTLTSDIIVGANSALGIGFTKDEFSDVMADYLIDNGGFSNAEGAVKNALVLNQPLKINSGNKIDVDYQKTTTSPDQPITAAVNAKANEVLIADGSALILTDAAFGNDYTQAAIQFQGTDGTIVGSTDPKSKNPSKVILVGDFSETTTDLKLADVKNGGSAKDATVSGTLTIEAMGGLLTGTLTDATKSSFKLTVSEENEAKARAGVSKPVADMIIAKMKNKLDADKTSDGYKFLVKSLNGNKTNIDAAAHAATYAGAQQAAVAAVGTLAGAVGGRVGSMGVEATAITATGSQANGGVWLAPMYQSVDVDGFNAEGASYGADVDLGGVAFGADTVNGNMRFGAVFNIGSGDADGKGNGAGLKDEFDYYGFGIYSVMGFGQLAIVGDASLSVISHEVEGLEAKGEADTTAVTMGVTGQYTISNPMVDVTPHLGARFIRLDTDAYDLTVDGNVLASTDFDVQNVFSIPLGVTLSKAFEMGGWSLAPSADLSITFNTGDTEAKSNTRFDGINTNLGLTTEVLDEVTYGVAVGLGAQYGAFGTQIGINYTGSENTDSFGVNANARYMF